jgi:hypothetical protein
MTALGAEVARATIPTATVVGMAGPTVGEREHDKSPFFQP